jgi:hypothetical protein
MPVPRNKLQAEMLQAWRIYLNALEKALNSLELQINEAAGGTLTRTEQWYHALVQSIDDIHNALFSISEPHWLSAKDLKRIKQMKRRVHDLYAMHRDIDPKAP